MEELEKEIKRKRQELLELSGGKKYIRRGQAERLLQPTPQEPIHPTIHPKILVQKEAEVIDLTQTEIFHRLRTLSQPIRLFGETDIQQYKRLLKLESSQQSSGSKNDFKSLLIASSIESTNSDFKPIVKNIQETIDTSEISPKLLISNPSLLRKLIPIYFQRLTTEWEFTLSIRPISVKQSAHGRLQAANHKQTIEYLQPFYESIKKDELAADVLLRITEICDFMLKKEYMQANDSYVQLSIGNAPWPLGVTAIHAHERSTDKKLYSSEIGHVLNDETQRKWIQSLKRLMSFCQSVRPNDDVSKNIG